jgi:hypothetical protein
MCKTNSAFRLRLALSLALLATLASRVTAAPLLEIEPKAVTLEGPVARQQLLVTARDKSQAFDVTAEVSLTARPAMTVVIQPGGVLLPGEEGEAVVTARYQGREATVRITVRGLSDPAPPSFRRDVMAVLCKGGCNAGTCHGSPSGKNGFALSLRGYDAAADHLVLTRGVLGRRVDACEPDASLLLLKASGAITHGGGSRLARSGRCYALLRAWIAAGVPDDAARAPLRRLEVLPSERELRGRAGHQQLVVLAHFADGRVRDVTDLAVFSSSDESVAEVSETGLVERKGLGETSVLVRYLEQMATASLSFLPEREAAWQPPAPNNFIDRLVFAKLKRLGIEPAPLASDEEFVRRAALDTIGTVLSADTAREFLESKDPRKRELLIDRLLERTEYADFWALKWSDVLRASRPNMALSEVVKFQNWLREQLARNVPYDRFARALLTAADTPFDNPAVLFFRAGDTPVEWGETSAQVFLGIRMQCAKCHNHPFERWTRDDYYGLAAFFARLKHNPKRPEHRYAGSEGWWLGRTGEQVNPRTGQPAPPRAPGAGASTIPEGKDRREVFADWLVRPDNPYFARAAVNRIWFHLLGRGIVEPADDFRDSNPPANGPLLDALAADFSAHGYDVKHVIRTILRSRTYQLSSQPNASNTHDKKYFSHALPRLLTGEQLLDSLASATGVPADFEGLPHGNRAARVPDAVASNMFLKAFGMPERLSNCTCERVQEVNFTATLQLMNGDTVQRQLRAPDNRVDRLVRQGQPPEKMVEELFLAALNRYPNPVERASLVPLVRSATEPKKELRNILWALVNSHEFQYRH